MKITDFVLAVVLCCFTSALYAMPNVYPTGTTIYKPSQCENGYTILSGFTGATLIDMNGNVVKQWTIEAGEPNKLLPGGYLLAGMQGGRRGINTVVQMDWDGKIVWKFDHFEQASGSAGRRGPGGQRGGFGMALREQGASRDGFGAERRGQGASRDGFGAERRGPRAPGAASGEKIWSANQHHDFQREGNPVGYYTPELEPLVDRGNTLILAHTTSENSKISSNSLRDDVIYEVSWEGEILWKWVASEHVDEMGFNEEELKSMRASRAPVLDWFHANCASYVGPNKWHDAGDERFHPDNVILDSRNANILCIISKKTGKIVWQIGPRYDESPQLRRLGWIVGPHHTHIIPKGLPGAGNIMVYDNGGSAGYGPPDPINRYSYNRDYSRVIEFDPGTLEKVWEYSPRACGYFIMDSMKIYSPYLSSAQRLVNGNTLITEGGLGRVFEVTPDLQVVWEWISQDTKIKPMPGPPGMPKQIVPNAHVFRAYRVPYEYVPQLAKPKEEAVIPPENKHFKVSGSGDTLGVR